MFLRIKINKFIIFPKNDNIERLKMMKFRLHQKSKTNEKVCGNIPWVEISRFN